MVKENKARKHARALQSQSTELTIYTDLTPTCYFVKVIASPIDQVDRVVEGALAKEGFLRWYQYFWFGNLWTEIC